MCHRLWLLGGAVLLCSACGPSANVEQERNALLQVDRDWSQTVKESDKFLSYFASDASVYAPGMAKVTGAGPIKEAVTQMFSAPDFSLTWNAERAEVSAAGDVGYTTGTYQMGAGGSSEKGKYVTVWKKQPDGQWKVVEDIFNADAGPAAPPSPHVSVAPAAVTWGDAPAALPPGAKLAVIAGDPGKPVPFVVRLQVPAGYQIAPHWHPTDENVTVLSGTFALGMGEKFDQASLKDLPAGGYAVLPAEMRHFAMARTAATVQVHGMGPFVLNYVNPADDPSQKK